MASLSPTAPPAPRWRVLLRTWRLALALACLGPLAVRAASPEPEYQIKAVFLFQFAEFVEWPATAFAAADAPFRIGIIGRDPFGKYLDELVRDEKIAGRRMQVVRSERIEELASCQIVYVCSSAASQREAIFAVLGNRPTLTVSDAEGFAKSGGMIGFVTEAGKIRLRINFDAARGAGLVISSKLLRPATIVTTTRN